MGKEGKKKKKKKKKEGEKEILFVPFRDHVIWPGQREDWEKEKRLNTTTRMRKYIYVSAA